MQQCYWLRTRLRMLVRWVSGGSNFSSIAYLKGSHYSVVKVHVDSLEESFINGLLMRTARVVRVINMFRLYGA
jgi:hypothetical protein